MVTKTKTGKSTWREREQSEKFEKWVFQITLGAKEGPGGRANVQKLRTTSSVQERKGVWGGRTEKKHTHWQSIENFGRKTGARGTNEKRGGRRRVGGLGNGGVNKRWSL